MKNTSFNFIHRPRRLRKNENIRALVRETSITVDDLIQPIFIQYGKKEKSEIPSMPGIYRYSTDSVLSYAESLLKAGITRVILFGIPDKKDAVGSDAISGNGIIQKSISAIKKNFPEMYVISDVCMCEYTDHGHCGILDKGDVQNDQTLEYLQKQSVSHANSGVDMVAPSAMMDGMVAAIRNILDKKGFEQIPIMSYSVKYASAFYGPFRDAADSTPESGDRKRYQMDPANYREAMKEMELDVAVGADIVMVKPALSYLDIIKSVKESCDLPVAAYNVSGEYAMIKAAEEKRWIDGKKARDEMLLSIKRAGADVIVSYFAYEWAISQ